jgi:hypothetical protein
MVQPRRDVGVRKVVQITMDHIDLKLRLEIGRSRIGMPISETGYEVRDAVHDRRRP